MIANPNIIFFKRVQEAFKFLIDSLDYQVINQEASEASFYGGQITYESSAICIWMSWERVERLFIEFAQPSKNQWYSFRLVYSYLDFQQSGKTDLIDLSHQPEELATLLQVCLKQIELLFSAQDFTAHQRGLKTLRWRDQSKCFGYPDPKQLEDFLALE